MRVGAYLFDCSGKAFHLPSSRINSRKLLEVISFSQFGGAMLETAQWLLKDSSKRKCWEGEDLCKFLKLSSGKCLFISLFFIDSAKHKGILQYLLHLTNFRQKQQQVLLFARYVSPSAFEVALRIFWWNRFMFIYSKPLQGMRQGW